MALSINGFGTKYYGKRDLGEMGSYTTTEWVVLLYIPIFPISSYRVIPIAPETNLVVYSSQSFMSQKLPLCLKQIANVYLTATLILCLVALFFIFIDPILDFFSKFLSPT
jgi:hypothetical protein